MSEKGRGADCDILCIHKADSESAYINTTQLYEYTVSKNYLF